MCRPEIREAGPYFGRVDDEVLNYQGKVESWATPATGSIKNSEDLVKMPIVREVRMNR